MAWYTPTQVGALVWGAVELIWGHKVGLFVRLIELVTRVPRLSRRSELEPVRPRSKSRYLILFGGISFMFLTVKTRVRDPLTLFAHATLWAHTTV